MRKNRKNGFTLVEILAVFVILGIIALIAIYSVNNIKETVAKKTYTESVKNLLTAAQQYQSQGNISTKISINALDIENKSQYISGSIKYIDNKLVAYNVSDGNYCASGPIDDLKVTDGKCSNSYLYYYNGESIYFNPTTGKVCSDYTSANSNSTANNICMKWYVYSDNEESSSLNLLLDHNVLENVAFTDISISLKNATSSYIKLLNPNILTSSDIANIIGDTNLQDSYNYYFDSGISTPSSSCNNSSTSTCLYGWIYDRTNTSCQTYGCLNNSNKYALGYWISNSSVVNPNNILYVDYEGKVSLSNNSSNNTGLRVTIKVKKSEL